MGTNEGDRLESLPAGYCTNTALLSVPAKKARLEAKINGLAKVKIESSFQEESMKM